MLSNFYKFKMLTHNDSLLRYQEQLEIVYVLEGEGTLHLTQSHATYNFKKGDIFVVNSFEPRIIQLDKNGLAISLTVSYNFLVANRPDDDNLFFDAKSFLFQGKQHSSFDALRKSFAKAFYTFYKDEANLQIMMRNHILEILSILIINFRVEKKQGYQSNLDYLNEIIHHIHKHYNENISLVDISDHVGLSSAYVSRVFKESMNMTLTDYMSLIKIQKAISLLSTNKTLTEIAYESGFPSHNSMIAAFKKHENMTPTDYRTNILYVEEFPIKKANEFGLSSAFEHLIDLLDESDLDKQDSLPDVKEVFVNVKKDSTRINNTFRNSINLGYAKMILNKDIQDQIRKAQDEVAFKYLRVKGILDDDMLVYAFGYEGPPIISFVYVNEVIDFILSVNAKPYIEIGFMPKPLTIHPHRSLRYTSHISAPSDYDEWGRLVGSLMKHLVDRYGQKEVSSWMFSPWINVSYALFGAFTVEQYFRTYAASYRKIKEAAPALIVGPDLNISEINILRFLEVAMKYNIMPDIISFVNFTVTAKNYQEELDLNFSPEAFPYAVSADENKLETSYHNIKEVLEKYEIEDIPISITEWSNNIWQRDLANDTLFKSSFIFKNLLENSHLYSYIGHHTLVEQLDEVAPSDSIFSGGFGLFTRKGIPKSAYYAYTLLAKMGDRLLEKDEGYFISKKDNSYQIYLYNYTHYDLLYRYRQSTNLTTTNRYNIFNHKNNIVYNVQLSNLEAGEYEIIHHIINEEGGSAYDILVAMGAPDKLNDDEYQYLIGKSKPIYVRATTSSSGVLNINIELHPHETVLIEAIKID